MLFVQSMLSLVCHKVLFWGQSYLILYFKSAELIANLHGLDVYSYADDIQCYFSFNRDTSVDIIKNKIRAFFQDLRHWMTFIFLKLNESKTKIIKIYQIVILNSE